MHYQDLQHKKDIHHLHDKSYKDLFSKKEIALDLFKRQIKEDWIKDLTYDNLKLVNKSFVTLDYSDTECDLVYEGNFDDEKVIFYILLEFQSSVDYTMPIRLLFYMCEILREYVKNNNHKKYDKNIKIPAVLPIVLYNGNRVWDVPTEFKEIIYNAKRFGNDILNFKYNVIDVNNKLDKDMLMELKGVSSAIFLLDQKIDPMEFLRRVRAIAVAYDTLTEEEMKSLKHWIRNTIDKKLADTAIQILEADKEGVDMMVANNAFILTEMKEEAKKQGLAEGIKEGKKEGVELAKKVFKLSISGHSVTEIAEKCKISVIDVEKILE